MIWRPTAMIVAAFAVAGLAIWFGPDILALFLPRDFSILGQVCGVVVALSVLDAVFHRIT